MSKEDQKKTLKQGRGCLAKVKRIKDPLEWAYTLTICVKTNDNEVSFFTFIRCGERF